MNQHVVGVAAERDAYRPQDVPRFAYQYITPGVFLQDDITIAPWLSVSASGRVDIHSQFGTFFSPRLSALARWKADALAPRLAGTRGAINIGPVNFSGRL